MQPRQAHQTVVSARGYLPYPLNPPYYVNRTEEYQKRVFEYAHNYFSPAEMGDLTRLEIFFVPQEAERMKRSLRRKGDFDPDTSFHPSLSQGNTEERKAEYDLMRAQVGNDELEDKEWQTKGPQLTLPKTPFLIGINTPELRAIPEM